MGFACMPQAGSPRGSSASDVEARASPDHAEPLQVRFEMHAQNRDCVKDGLCLMPGRMGLRIPRHQMWKLLHPQTMESR